MVSVVIFIILKAITQFPLLYIFHYICQWNFNCLDTQLIAKAIKCSDFIDQYVEQSLVCENMQFTGQFEFIRLHKFDRRLEYLLSIIAVMGLLVPDAHRKNNETVQDIDSFVKQQIPYAQHVLFYTMTYQCKYNP